MTNGNDIRPTERLRGSGATDSVDSNDDGEENTQETVEEEDNAVPGIDFDSWPYCEKGFDPEKDNPEDWGTIEEGHPSYKAPDGGAASDAETEQEEVDG